MKIIKYNQSKTSQSGTRTLGGNGGGIYTNTTPAPSVNLEPYALKTQILWEKGEGNNSVIEKSHNLQATNENETAVGKYNQSVSGETIFTVGIGDGEDSRKNGLAVTSSGLSAETASFDNLTSVTASIDSLTSNTANIGDVTAKTENVGTLTSHTITNNGLIKTNQFETQTLQAVSGYIQSLMSEEITTEYLEVTKAAHFFKLVIDEIKAVGGRLIITPASAEIHHVEELSDRFRCYFKASDGKKQIYQEFEKDDQIICQTFNASVGTSYDVSNTYYWRLCVGVSPSTVTIDGDDFFYVDLSKTDKDKYSVSTPRSGDNIVQLGNRTKEDRQAAIVISAYNDGYLDPEIKAPSLVQYQGINDYSLKNHRLNIISKGLNQFKGAHLNNADKNLDTKIDDLSTTVSNKVSEITQTINGISTRVSNTETSISNVTKTVSDNKAATDKAIANTNSTVTTLTQTVKNNYSTLDQKADSISSRVSANTKSITTVTKTVSDNKAATDKAISDNKAATDKAIANTNSTITTLTKTVKDNYSTLDQKADGIKATVSENTKSITTVSKKVDDNKAATDKAIANTNNTITALTQTVKNNYSTLDQKADGIKATVSAHTQTITAQGTSISNLQSGLNNTNNTITALTKTVKDNYSTLDQKADSISSRVSSNSETITAQGTNISNLQSGLNNTNNTITALTKTVKNNYSTLDQKADGISTTVSTNTKSINELNGKITSQATAISKVDQKADSISSTVQTINNNYASKSLLTQTSNNILAQVNNTYIKIGDDNITLGGNTTVKGSLTLTQTNQGFKLIGSEGITEIMPKSIGTYNDFKSSNTNTQQVIKSINVNGAKSDSDDILRFQGSLIIYLGDRKKGDFIKVKFNSLNSKVTNAWNGSSFSGTFDLSGSFTAKVMNQYNSAVIHNWNTVYSNREYSYTFDSDTTNARIYVTFSGNTLYSSWIGNYNIHQGKPMPMPNALAEVNCTLTLPTTAHMLIGYDGWGVNFGNNKTVYCGKDGFIASYGNNEFRITSEGISHNNMATTHTIIGSSSSSSPTIYEVQDPVDFVLCKSGNCKIKMPKTPYNGQTIKVLDKSSDETWIDFNGNYVCPCDTKYESRSLNSNWSCKGFVPRLFTYLDNTWYEEYMG